MSTRVRCSLHNLDYDASVHSGCVICRREAGKDVPGQWRMPLVVAGTGTALVLSGYFGFQAMKGDVGARCDGTFGCVDGSSCLAFSQGPMPPLLAENGICVASCEDNAVCPLGQACRDAADGRFCLQVAEPGEDCGGAVVCPEDWTCLGLDDARFRCRAHCGEDGDCPERYSCERIVARNQLGRTLSPEQLPYPGLGLDTGHYCMPLPD